MHFHKNKVLKEMYFSFVHKNPEIQIHPMIYEPFLLPNLGLETIKSL